MMSQRLIDSVGNEVYDPFQSPPNLLKAADHRKANSVGIDIDEGDDIRICPCCENIIDKQPISLACQDEQLLFLGIGYPLYYKLTRYFAIIIGLILFLSGSGLYFLVTLNCKSECVYFLGIPIINLQVSGEQSAQLTDVVNIFTAFSIFVVVMFIKSRLYIDINELQGKILSPEQYTILLQNLPEDMNEEEVTDWCKQKFNSKPILINFAYNVSELSEAYANRQELTIKMNKYIIQRNDLENENEHNQKSLLDESIKEMAEKLKEYDKVLNYYKQENIVCRKVGTVFVTFSEQSTVAGIIEKHESSFINFLFNSLMSPIKKPPLIFKGKSVIVNRAPAPREVIWSNLSFSFVRTIVAEIIFFATMIFLITGAFKIQYFVVNYSYELRQESQDTGETIIIIEAIVMSLIVVVLNSLLRLVIKLFCSIKQYYSYTMYQSAFCFYYSLMYILNTCFMIYIVHSHRNLEGIPEDQHDHVLIYDIHLIMLASAFSEPLFKMFDPLMWFRYLWRNYVASIKKEKNPYTQAYANALWEGYDISNADNYQYIYRTLIVTTWYAHCAPFGVILSLIGLFIDYWICKIFLLRFFKKPENISKLIATPMINTLELLPLIYICGLLEFTYKVSTSENLFTFLTQFLQYGITTTVLLICILGYFVLSKPVAPTINPVHYDEVEIMFPYNYQTQNPITKLKGEIKYLYGVIRRGTNKNDSKIIKQLLEINKQKSADDLVERQSELAKIKRRNLRKLDTLESSMEFKEQQMKEIKPIRQDTSSYSSM